MKKLLVFLFVISLFSLVIGNVIYVADPGATLQSCNGSCSSAAGNGYSCFLSGSAIKYDNNGNPLAVSLNLSISCRVILGLTSPSCSASDTFSGMGSVSGAVSCLVNTGPFQGPCYTNKNCSCN
ncbi:hypothetical protein [Geotoga petraea]|uniref:Uncharacterized protein n=1 Tax=Geotoga petraea TaxID=28234 RepID=A0A4Z0W6L2_9BACT|nr:hypothetical protein [Geotoga petraea]TGG88724.1 hypothetical protein E4650_00545 [Geotoga petraea]